MEKEKNHRLEEALRLTSERTNLDTTVKTIEQELAILAKRNHEMEAMLADQEQTHAHRILELTSRHRQVKYSSYSVIVTPELLKRSNYNR